MRQRTAGDPASATPLIANAEVSRTSRWMSLDFWLPLALLTVTLLAFSPLFDAEFVRRDDTMTITENPAMFGSPAEIAHFWTNVKQPTGNIYIPLTETVWYLLARVARLNQPTPEGMRLSAFPFHLANLLLHALNGWLVYRILRRLDMDPWAAAAGAALYLLHPVQVEVTAWVSGLKDVMGATFSLAAIHAFLRFVQAERASAARRWSWYFAGTLSLIAAMFAKPATVVAPLLALIVSAGWLARRNSSGKRDPANSAAPGPANLRRLLAPLLAWFVLTVPIIVEGRHAQPGDIAPTIALWMRPLVAGDALYFYLRKLVAPVSLGLDYSRTPAAIARSGALYWAWVFPAAILLLAYRVRKRQPLVWTGLLVFFAAPLPVLGFVKFDFQYFSTVSDRYLYVAMLGVAVLMGAAMNAGGAHRLARISCAAVVLVSGALTYLQSGYWHDNFALWYHAYNVNPGSFAAEWEVGRIFADRAAAERAAGYPQRADDDNAFAIEFFTRALPLDSDPAQSQRSLAELYFRQQNFARAAEHFQAVLSRFPADAEMRSSLGIALAHLHRFAEARAALEAAIRLNPHSADYETKLGDVLNEQGDRAAAAEHFRRALAVDPQFEPAHRGLNQVPDGIP